MIGSTTSVVLCIEWWNIRQIKIVETIQLNWLWGITAHIKMCFQSELSEYNFDCCWISGGFHHAKHIDIDVDYDGNDWIGIELKPYL